MSSVLAQHLLSKLSPRPSSSNYDSHFSHGSEIVRGHNYYDKL